MNNVIHIVLLAGQ